MLEDAGERQGSVLLPVVLGNRRVADADRPVSRVDQFIQRDEGILERERAGHDLERRTGLVGVGDRAVAAVLSRGSSVVVRVEGRCTRHRQDRSVRRVEEDRDPRLRVGVLYGRCELLLRGELDSRIEGREERGALLRRLPARRLRLTVSRAAGVRQRHDLSRLAPDRRVVEVLEAPEALVVGPDVADNVRGQRSLRV